ncbi:Lacal_2735 family protein [Jiulongibacter sediminis]|jgi:hypothetical protein|uniref:GTP cyclohydrolase I n=1 Tax=Jiulongibacter sediminis TaxID=1605367 RepID=A0A0P7C513_9BACT|nr:Lacal_2735 family protein [Jiulongibacter sediminis]KPM49814.1 GTP cyclohydrolase I [Jiulongibacter sediminis]TBX26851.1 GTP cyclohydrolase I [Jiulongibacter sediminis]
MFNLFKSKKEKLQLKHRKLLEQAFQMSRIDRSKSDQLHAEAGKVLEEIEKL